MIRSVFLLLACDHHFCSWVLAELSFDLATKRQLVIAARDSDRIDRPRKRWPLSNRSRFA
ncbi:hypothetical protein BCV70DRAFT_198892 [Testicularia cyperi]|uniref:Uncharacterized protein n=1 Tax=Testicularia cyperi TaxID=1882483 RepID=A0A317XT45_9BASI|nr:hypothetical protein BCV70DRAFT_198892 [Testicularia cyperi]